MNEVHQLPYKEPPPQLTATARSKSLREHYLAFTAVNGGDKKISTELVAPDETIGDILLFAGLETQMAFWVLKMLARRIRMLARGQVGFMQSQELLSKALGYRTYAALCAANPEKKIALNIRGGQEVPFSMALFNAEAPTRADRQLRRERTTKLRDNPKIQA